MADKTYSLNLTKEEVMALYAALSKMPVPLAEAPRYIAIRDKLQVSVMELEKEAAALRAKTNTDVNNK